MLNPIHTITIDISGSSLAFFMAEKLFSRHVSLIHCAKDAESKQVKAMFLNSAADTRKAYIACKKSAEIALHA